MLKRLLQVFKSTPRESEVADLKKQLLRICAGALMQGRTLTEIQAFLVQYVAASDFPVKGSAELINSVIEEFAALVQSTGVQPENLRSEPEQTTAVEKSIGGYVYVEVTEKTHAFKKEKPERKKKEEKHA